MEKLPLVELRGIGKRYGQGEAAFDALKGVDFTIEQGDFVAVMGPSGSGKSTCMNIIGALDTPTYGEYLFQGVHVESLTRDERSLLRRQYFGFVFQGFNLISRTSETKFYLPDTANKKYIELAEYMKNEANNSSRKIFEIHTDDILDSGAFIVQDYVLSGYDLTDIPIELSNDNTYSGSIGKEAFADTQLARLQFSHDDNNTWTLTLEDKAFYNHSLESISLPPCTTLGNDVFSTADTNTITQIICSPATVPYLAYTEDTSLNNVASSEVTQLTVGYGALSEIVSSFTQLYDTDPNYSFEETMYPLQEIMWPKLTTFNGKDDNIHLITEWDTEVGEFSNLAGLFGHSTIQYISIPKIADSSHFNSFKLKYIQIPTNFCRGSTKLESINIDTLLSNANIVGMNAFNGCLALRLSDADNLSSNIEYIKENAFKNCVLLTGSFITSMSKLRIIEAEAFKGCTVIDELNLTDSPIAVIGANAFTNTQLTDISLPDRLIDIGVNAFGSYHASNIIGKHLIHISLEDTSSTELDLSEYDILTIADQPEAETANTTITNLILPRSLKLIGAKAFAQFEALETVEVSDIPTDVALDIQVIREDAFNSNIKVLELDSNKYLIKNFFLFFVGIAPLFTRLMTCDLVG